MSDIKKSVKINAIAYMYFQGTTALLQLVQIPLLLHYWGKELFGEWLIVTGLASTLVLLDVGVARASESKAISLASSNKWNDVRRSIHTAQAFTLAISSLIFIAMMAIPFVNWEGALHLKLISSKEATNIILCMLLAVVNSLQMGVIDAKFKVIGKVAIGTFIIANRRVVSIALLAISAAKGYSPQIVAVVYIIGDIIYMLLAEGICRKMSKEKIHGFREANMDEFKTIVKPAVSYLAFPISQTITLQGGIQLLNQYSGSNDVVKFTMVRTMTRIALQIGTVANNALKPEISRLAGSNNAEAINAIRRKTIQISLIVGIASLIGLALFGPLLVGLWSHHKISASRFMILMVGIHAVLNLIWMAPAAIEMGLNQHGKIGLAVLVSSIIPFGIWIALGKLIPPEIGASLLLAIPEAAAACIMFLKKKKEPM